MPNNKVSSEGLKLEDVLRTAREKLSPRCRVCRECDGVVCSGEVPGFGGIGTGSSFRANIEALARRRFRMRVVHTVKRPDTSFLLWGETLAMPVLAAALGGTTYNMGGKMGEEEFIDAILGGCVIAGTVGMAADGIGDSLDVYETRLKAVAAHRGKAIAMIKPRTQEEILRRIRLAEASGALAIGIDIDSAGRAARAQPGQTVEPKTADQLRELTASTKLPFIVKGIMTPEDARTAMDAGAAAIVVSNHGGRVLDHTPGGADVLPEIADAVKGRALVFCDGGVRHGVDVLKLLALGADAVLVGRPLIRGAFGGGPEGVSLVLNKIKAELLEAMVMTGTESVKNVGRDILVQPA